MAKPTDRASFIEYCMRNLGAPVINIEVAPDQIDDRVDEAIQTWQEKHYDASEDMWVYYKVTDDDISTGYITVPDEYLSVYKVETLSSIGGGSSSGPDSEFTPQYQVMLSGLISWQPFDTLDYFMKMENLQFTEDLIGFDGDTIRFKFIRHEHKLKVYSNIAAGSNLLFRVFRLLDEQYIWDDKWLKDYATSLIKKQWGENISKYKDVQLLGNVTISGDRLIQEATQEITDLITQLESQYEEPVTFIFG